MLYNDNKTTYAVDRFVPDEVDQSNDVFLIVVGPDFRGLARIADA